MGLDRDLDVDSNVVLDGNVDLDSFVDLDLAPSTILDEDSATPSKSRCKVERWSRSLRRRATSRSRDNVDVNLDVFGGRSRPLIDRSSVTGIEDQV